MFTTMTAIMDHFYSNHQDSIEGADISSLIPHSAQQRMGINACPLCEVRGPSDSPELLDHVLEHIHDFSLRSLPWPRPGDVDSGGEVWTFRPDMTDAPHIIQWIFAVQDADQASSDKTDHRQPCQYDYNRLDLLADQEMPSRQCDFPVDICFADEQGDKSSRATQQTSSRSSGTHSFLDDSMTNNFYFAYGYLESSLRLEESPAQLRNQPIACIQGQAQFG